MSEESFAEGKLDEPLTDALRRSGKSARAPFELQ